MCHSDCKNACLIQCNTALYRHLCKDGVRYCRSYLERIYTRCAVFRVTFTWGKHSDGSNIAVAEHR